MSVDASNSYRSQYDLAFQVSPIILQNGIATGVQGGLLPITSLTGGPPTTLDAAFAHYITLPGGTLIDQAVGMYPFANQAVAANATIQQPLTLSLLMIAPVNQPGGYLTKLQTFSALQNSLALHNASGGIYIVATPAYIYNNLLLIRMTDMTNAEDKQKQIEWQLDFIQPIITLQGAAAQLNNLMSKVSAGTAFASGQVSWSGNSEASPANLSGVIAALGAFGGVISNSTGFSETTGAAPGAT